MPGFVYTEIFADKIDERYSQAAISGAGVNQNYSWDGAKAVKVTSVSTVGMKDYDRAGGYGTPDGLSNAIQTMLLTKDRSFRALLDKMDENETKVKSGEVLGRQMREIVVPEIETYRFGVMTGAILTENIVTKDSYEGFLEANEILDDNAVPMGNRVAYATPNFINKIKLDTSFIKAGDLSQNILIKGQIGEIDGIPVIKAPKAWLNGYECIIVDKAATVAPIKLAEYEAINHPDYSGTMFQGRFVYDAFVLDMKKNGLVGIKP